MGLAVLELRNGEHVPGTVVFDSSAADFQDDGNTFKRGSGKDSHLVLIPQPSVDPNDPLN